MAALPTQVLVPGGSASTLTAAAGGGDTATPGDGVFLEVFNSDASSKTVTIATPGTVDGLAIADRAITIPAGERWKIPLTRMYAGGDGQATITYSAVTSVTVGVFKVA
ncbi:hypothetical protein [Streptosporangium roseum]|jgi:hypothetical protein|uniref:hypothetical protein n=1 Tax=Streptosporangium roseum TaxID=2001 RepID=UPI0004CC927E|nr:hypothetical protein [Streptosporangium roseum]